MATRAAGLAAETKEISLGLQDPVDLYEEILSSQMNSLSSAAIQMVNSEEYARFTGSMLNANLSAELLLRPLVPPASLEIATQWLQLMEKQTALALGSFSDLLRWDSEALLRHFVIWNRITNTPYPIASTSNQLVWQNGPIQLRRFISSSVPHKKRIPLILVFALMSTPGIFDLMPGKSFVEYMLSSGFDVYLIDWGAPTRAERDFTFGTYADFYLPQMVECVKELSDCREFSMLGWCIGAILTSIYAAKRPNEGLRNLMLLTPPLDFSDESLTFKKWLRYIDVEKLIEADGGLVSGERIGLGAELLKPIENMGGNYLKLYQHLDEPKFVEGWHAMDTWVKMKVPMAGGVYRELARNLYLRNELTQGRFRIDDGEPVDLGQVKCNLLVLAADQDHVTPPQQAKLAFPYFTGSRDKELMDLHGGHIGAMAGSGAIKKTWPALKAWLELRS